MSESKEITHKPGGGFAKGWKGGPGRRPGMHADVRIKYLTVLSESVPVDKWRQVCEKAIEQAMAGDHRARAFLANYLVGKPVQAVELSGPGGSDLNLFKVINVILGEFGDDPNARLKIGKALRQLELSSDPPAIDVTPGSSDADQS